MKQFDVDGKFASVGGGENFEMNSVENQEGYVYGLDYLEKKKQEIEKLIQEKEQALKKQEEEIRCYDKGKLTDKGYVVKDPETGEEKVFLSRDFINERLKLIAFKNKTEKEIIEMFKPIISESEKNFLRIIKNNLNTITSDYEYLRKFYTREIDNFDYTTPDSLLKTVNFENLRYIEIIAVIEKAVKEKNFDIADLQKLFDASESRVRLAIVELLPDLFKNTQQENLVRDFLQRNVIDFSVAGDGNKNIAYPNKYDSVYIEKPFAWYDDPERDVFAFKVLEALSFFGESAVVNLQDIFQYNRNSIEKQGVVGYNKLLDIYSDEEREIMLPSDTLGEKGYYYDQGIDREGDLIDQEIKDFVDGYYYENVYILQILSSFGDLRTVDFILDFVVNDEASVFVYKNEIVDVLNSINVNYAVSQLHKLLRSSDGVVRERVGKLLFRLEVGKIGISEKGVEYLEKVFDLKELNNPDFFAQRMTASGVVGVFNEEGVPEHYFKIKMEDLFSDENVINPKILRFTVESLFYSNVNESQDERKLREEIFQEFRENYFEVYINRFKEETGVNFNNFELYEQAQFLRYYLGQDEYHKQGLFDFIRKHKENGLKTFISLEQGGLEMGEKILTIGERFAEKPRLADAIFAKYAELVDAVDKVGDYLREEFGREDVELIREIQENLLVRGKAILVLFADKEMTEGEVMKRLGEINVEAVVMFSLFKTLKKNGSDISLEDLKETQLKIESGHELLQKQEVIKRMKEIYRENWNNYPEDTKEALIKNFENNLLNQNSRFYVLYYKGKVIAFNCFTTQDNREVYFSNFNVDQVYRSLQIGEAMMEVSLDKEMSKATIVASVLKDVPIKEKYLKDKGFKVVGEKKIGSVDFLVIKKNKNK